MKTIQKLTLCLSLLLLVNCTYKLAQQTLISTKDMHIAADKMGPKVSGMDCTIMIILPLGNAWNDLNDAIDKAIESAGPEYDALLNPTIYAVNQHVLVGRICTKVEGIAINTKDLGEILESHNNNYVIHSQKID